MSKGLPAFKKICKNLNSYEFTDEYKEKKKLIEKELFEREQHKKIEKELGVDLITLFKAIKDGGWVKTYEMKSNPAYDENGDLCSRNEPYWIADKKKPIIEKRRFILRHDESHLLFFSINARFGRQDFYPKDIGKTWSLNKEDLL